MKRAVSKSMTTGGRRPRLSMGDTPSPIPQKPPTPPSTPCSPNMMELQPKKVYATCEKKKPEAKKPGPNYKPPEFRKGGKVKSTGYIKAHKGEIVIPASLVKKMEKLMK